MRPFSVFLFAGLFVLSASARAAVINPLSSLLLTSPDTSNAFPDTSLPANRTVSEPPGCVNAFPTLVVPPLMHIPRVLPPSPYVYLVPSDHTTVITFFAYSGAISELSAVEAMLVINEDIRAELVDALHDLDPDRLMPRGYMRVDAEHASLTITTIDGQMKWVTCSQTLVALRVFLVRWEYIGLSFTVEVEGAKVGIGVLASR